MVRLGIYTGKIYDSTYPIEDIRECCLCLNYKEPVDPNEELVRRQYDNHHASCIGCYGCEESRNGFIPEGGD